METLYLQPWHKSFQDNMCINSFQLKTSLLSLEKFHVRSAILLKTRRICNLYCWETGRSLTSIIHLSLKMIDKWPSLIMRGLRLLLKNLSWLCLSREHRSYFQYWHLHFQRLIWTLHARTRYRGSLIMLATILCIFIRELYRLIFTKTSQTQSRFEFKGKSF